jgi:hypothetical protein
MSEEAIGSEMEKYAMGLHDRLLDLWDICWAMQHDYEDWVNGAINEKQYSRYTERNEHELQNRLGMMQIELRNTNLLPADPNAPRDYVS